jgi:transcriptional regulator with XRE-family HTH domain
MTKTIVDRITQDPEGMRRYLQERLIVDVTEQLCELIEKKGIKRGELARKLGKSNAYVSQLLNGDANMTLRTMADLFWALDSSPVISAGPLKIKTSRSDLTDLFRVWENATQRDDASLLEFDDEQDPESIPPVHAIALKLGS